MGSRWVEMAGAVEAVTARVVRMLMGVKGFRMGGRNGSQAVSPDP